MLGLAVIRLPYLSLMTDEPLSVLRAGEVWQLSGLAAERFGVVNEFLTHLADRNYSPRTQRAYAFDLMSFGRWLEANGLALTEVDTDVLLRFLTACREAVLPGRAGGNVYSIKDAAHSRPEPAGRSAPGDAGRNTGYAPSTVNRRLAAISALFAFRQMRDLAVSNPVPRGRQAKGLARGARSGLLAHVAAPAPRSRLRLREPQRLPRGLSREESTLLLGSLRSWRDRAIAGLMLLSGLRSCEVLALQVADVDIARRWARVLGKGNKERRVPIDHDVAGVIQAYLLAERPETDSTALFVVAKGPNRGQPLTPAGLRTVFRYHRERAGVPAGHPHALRHSFGTALAEAGVDLSVIQALMGHDHVDSSAAYIHLAPSLLREEFDAARARLRTRP
jgi:site-specific recombinase XerD